MAVFSLPACTALTHSDVVIFFFYFFFFLWKVTIATPPSLMPPPTSGCSAQAAPDLGKDLLLPTEGWQLHLPAGTHVYCHAASGWLCRLDPLEAFVT